MPIVGQYKEHKLVRLDIKYPQFTDTKTCDECPLTFNPVPPSGPKSAELWVVGEAPGVSENKAEGAARMPFIGKAGKFLRETLLSVGVNIDLIRFWNAVLCLPLDDKGKPTNPSTPVVNRCSSFLRRDLAEQKPRVVILLGRVAADCMEDVVAGSISAYRHENPHQWDASLTIVTWHPSYILRTGGKSSKYYADWVGDLEYAHGLSGMSRGKNSGHVDGKESMSGGM